MGPLGAVALVALAIGATRGHPPYKGGPDGPTPGNGHSVGKKLAEFQEALKGE